MSRIIVIWIYSGNNPATGKNPTSFICFLQRLSDQGSAVTNRKWILFTSQILRTSLRTWIKRIRLHILID